MTKSEPQHGIDVFGQSQRPIGLGNAVAQTSDKAPAQPKRFQSHHSVLHADAYVKCRSQELLGPAEIRLRTKTGVTMVIGTENPEFRCGKHLRLVAAGFVHHSAQSGIGHANYGHKLQEAGA